MENNQFNYTYSSREQAEIKKIREKYEPQTEDKMQLLRRLDREVAKKASTTSITVGVIGALIMGTGMSVAMTELGSKLGTPGMVLGIAVGCVGMIIAAAAYPLYMRVTKKEREKIAPEIIRLTDELLK